MDLAKFLVDIFREFGAANTVFLVMLGCVVWVTVKVLPKFIERIVLAIEGLGKTFAAHDERANLLYQQVMSLQSDINTMQKSAITLESIMRIHERIDKAVLVLATKEDVDAVLKALDRHSDECERRSERIFDKVG
ncbi:MAG: hypothetical protein E6713_07740 [Sporomusaceae bacterium]|nr:hypothetical protein [Sporomusaceae bacterium]